MEKEEKFEVIYFGEDGKPECKGVGAYDSCADFIKRIKDGTKKEESIKSNFTSNQTYKMFGLKKEDKDILEVIRRITEQRNGKGPTPTDVLNELNINKKYVGKITRKINDVNGSLQKYLSLPEGGRGKQITFKKEFLDDNSF